MAAHRAPRPCPKPGSAPRCHDARHHFIVLHTCRGTSLPALHHCRPAASQATPYALNQAKIALSTAAAATVPSSQSSIRRQLRRPAHPLLKPSPGQIPLEGDRLHGGPRVPSWEAFGRRPSARADRSPRAGIRNPSPKRTISASVWGSRGQRITPVRTRSCCAIAPIGNLIGSFRVRGRSRCEHLVWPLRSDHVGFTLSRFRILCSGASKRVRASQRGRIWSGIDRYPDARLILPVSTAVSVATVLTTLSSGGFCTRE